MTTTYNISIAGCHGVTVIVGEQRERHELPPCNFGDPTGKCGRCDGTWTAGDPWQVLKRPPECSDNPLCGYNAETLVKGSTCGVCGSEPRDDGRRPNGCRGCAL